MNTAMFSNVQFNYRDNKAVAESQGFGFVSTFLVEQQQILL